MPKVSLASELIGLHGRPPINRDVLASRYAERDARQAADTRTEAEKILGDPPSDDKQERNITSVEFLRCCCHWVPPLIF